MYVQLPRANCTTNASQTSTDEALELITKNISGHMDSIESNLAQVEGIWEAIAKSKAAVQATLFEQLKAAQYREVVMG